MPGVSERVSDFIWQVFMKTDRLIGHLEPLCRNDTLPNKAKQTLLFFFLPVLRIGRRDVICVSFSQAKKGNYIRRVEKRLPIFAAVCCLSMKLLFVRVVLSR